MDEELALAAILENIIRLPSNTSLTVHTATGNGEGFISKHKTIHVKNLYKVLGLQRNATSADILGAYKRLSRILHPDKAHDKAIAEQMKDAFQEVVGAKEALLDASTRRTYDKDNLETMRKEEDEELAVAASPSAPIISSHTITDPLWKFGAHVTNKIANRVEDAVAAAAFVAIGAAAAKAASYLSSKAKAAPPSSPPSPPPPIPEPRQPKPKLPKPPLLPAKSKSKAMAAKPPPPPLPKHPPSPAAVEVLQNLEKVQALLKKSAAQQAEAQREDDRRENELRNRTEKLQHDLAVTGARIAARPGFHAPSPSFYDIGTPPRPPSSPYKAPAGEKLQEETEAERLKHARAKLLHEKKAGSWENVEWEDIQRPTTPRFFTTAPHSAPAAIEPATPVTFKAQNFPGYTIPPTTLSTPYIVPPARSTATEPVRFKSTFESNRDRATLQKAEADAMADREAAAKVEAILRRNAERVENAVEEASRLAAAKNLYSTQKLRETNPKQARLEEIERMPPATRQLYEEQRARDTPKAGKKPPKDDDFLREWTSLHPGAVRPVKQPAIPKAAPPAVPKGVEPLGRPQAIHQLVPMAPLPRKSGAKLPDFSALLPTGKQVAIGAGATAGAAAAAGLGYLAWKYGPKLFNKVKDAITGKKRKAEETVKELTHEVTAIKEGAKEALKEEMMDVGGSPPSPIKEEITISIQPPPKKQKGKPKKPPTPQADRTLVRVKRTDEQPFTPGRWAWPETAKRRLNDEQKKNGTYSPTHRAPPTSSALRWKYS